MGVSSLNIAMSQAQRMKTNHAVALLLNAINNDQRIFIRSPNHRLDLAEIKF